MVFEDFSDGSAGWRYFSDRVMGGVSDGGAALEQDNGVAFARLTGQVSTANNGGFVQIRRDLDMAFAADSTGLTLTVRGNGDDYFVHLRTTQTRRPWQYFQATFQTTPDWPTSPCPGRCSGHRVASPVQCVRPTSAVSASWPTGAITRPTSRWPKSWSTPRRMGETHAAHRPT